MVFTMIVIGGLTRLTGSGLSMVDWAPIMGILPPLSLEDWQAAFVAYQQHPEFQIMHPDMDLAGFQSIFWLEYIHRVWGRLMGLVLLVPTIIAFRHQALSEYRTRMIGLWMLGAGQALMGWYMVKSGLINEPWVSPYRLTAHLCLAALIMAAIVAMIHKIRCTVPVMLPRWRGIKRYMSLLFFMVCLTVVYGGFTAGMKAGLIYNTFPDMNGQMLPDDLWAMAPWYLNPVQNPTTVQFFHRILALSTLGLAGYIAYQMLQTPGVWRRFAFALIFVAGMQVVLGVSTLVMHVPISLAVIHQAWAFVLFITVFWIFLSVITGRQQRM